MFKPTTASYLSTLPFAVDVLNGAVQRLQRHEGLGGIVHGGKVVLQVTLLHRERRPFI